MLNLEECNVCPHKCGVNRYIETGYCKADINVKLNLYQINFTDEPNLSSKNGSGNIYFSHCNTSCVYCNSFSVSQFGWGKVVSKQSLADIMIGFEQSGVNNVHLVTPTHYSPQIIEGIKLAKEMGLSVPIVWNSNAYENVETLRELEGLVDIYLPDFRYFDSKAAKDYSNAENYPDVAPKAILEMFRQVGHLKESNEIAKKGIMIRILLLPENRNRVDKILKWIHDNLGKRTYISLMSQYYPTYSTAAYPEINRVLTKKEYEFAVDKLEVFGFENGFVQDIKGNNDWQPNFAKENNK